MSTPKTAFNPASALSAVHELRSTIRRRRTWGKSRLIPYRAELVKLRQAGGSFTDLQIWLRKEKRVSMDASSVRRFLQQLPELQEKTRSAGG